MELEVEIILRPGDGAIRLIFRDSNGTVVNDLGHGGVFDLNGVISLSWTCEAGDWKVSEAGALDPLIESKATALPLGANNSLLTEIETPVESGSPNPQDYVIEVQGAVNSAGVRFGRKLRV